MKTRRLRAITYREREISYTIQNSQNISFFPINGQIVIFPDKTDKNDKLLIGINSISVNR